jgi:hypothetical protein
MKARILGALCAGLFSLGLVSTANAGLFPVTAGPLDGLAVYDSDLDITWTRDADINGLNNWLTQVDWAGDLELGDFTDWRLPTTTQPDASCSTQFDDPVGGFPLQGFGGGCTGSEMGHIFNVDNVSSGSPGPFDNLSSYIYQSGTEYAPNNGLVWNFTPNAGSQTTGNKLDAFHAWAVHDGNPGNAVVPVPAAVWLFGSALGLLAWMRRRKAA